MTTYERLEEIKNAAELTLNNAHDTYYEAEAELVDLIGDYVMGAEVRCTAHGPGHIIAYKGTTLDNIIVDVEFASITKKFSLAHIITVAKFIKLEDIFEIGVIWDEAYAVHNEITSQFKALEKQVKLLEEAAAKKAEEEKKAAEKYEKQKAKALKDFETMAAQEKEIITQADEFYYSLGWLAKYASNVAAVLPDYLAEAFKKYFGPEAPCRIVDSKHRGPAGWQAQWSWSFTISLKKPELVPAFLSDKLNPAGKAVSKTSFIWDLVENYGFQFGKKQNIDKIRACVPSEHIDMFEAGLA